MNYQKKNYIYKIKNSLIKKKKKKLKKGMR